jgi:hypothetical protein
MKPVGICFSTKDRTELSDQSIKPLLRPHDFDLYLVDGSQTMEGQAWPFAFHKGHSPLRVIENIRGGADAAIVHNLSFLLDKGYDYVGLVENDVLLTDPDWFTRTMALFEMGYHDGLVVGAVSARCFADRILLQRPGYALMHNLGAGMVIMTRHAARLILDHYRSGWTLDNRSVFSQLSGIDIGRYWAFRGGEHWLTADWHFDTVLAAHGLASLALTPSPVEMVGQVPPLADQGLEIVNHEIDEFRNEDAFELYRERTARVRLKTWCTLVSRHFRDSQGELVFAHHFHEVLSGTWHLRWNQRFGPYAFESGPGTSPDEPSRQMPEIVFGVFGPCSVVVTGGETETRFRIRDEYSGFEITPPLQPGMFMAATVPAALTYRTIRLTALDPGLLFHGVHCVKPQPWGARSFDWSMLPKVKS